ncbi:MAG: tRNA (guanosine(46)-N7)-methyltransferase TrmB, partial [Spirochaetales bacterium]|nr:tRNA (guanosine(46)-N7)-methyltransferase TrmB [Spirochaetales bacterium]
KEQQHEPIVPFDGRQILNGTVRTFVLRSGRLTDAQKRALEQWGPRFIIPFSKEPLAPDTLFHRAAPLILEIGFGMGQATWQIARNRPDYNYLGIEVHTPGVGRLVMDLVRHGIENVRIIQHDAVEVMQGMLPAGSLAGIHIFYPDPWPKKRHHKRRLMQAAVVALMTGLLQPGGYLYFVTDIESYAHATREVLDAQPLLRNRYEGFAPHQEWRPETKFERHARESGRGAFELFYVRI